MFVGGKGRGGCGGMMRCMISVTLAAVMKDVGEIKEHASTQSHPVIHMHQ